MRSANKTAATVVVVVVKFSKAQRLRVRVEVVDIAQRRRAWSVEVERLVQAEAKLSSPAEIIRVFSWIPSPPLLVQVELRRVVTDGEHSLVSRTKRNCPRSS